MDPATTDSVTSGYAPVNGLEMYYEIYGSGEPLIMLHGGLLGISLFGGNVAALARNRRVIAVELQGHGRTADVERPLTFEGMADDVAELMKYLKIGQADVLGYSLGAAVALQLIFRHPGMVRRLILVATTFSHEGWYPEIIAAFQQMGPASAQGIKDSPWPRQYPKVNWEVLFTKLGELQRTSYDWSKQVAAIQAPTLLVFADADSVRFEHIVKFYELLGGGQRDAGWDGAARCGNQLAVLPGVTHYNIGASADLAYVAEKFLGLGRG